MKSRHLNAIKFIANKLGFEINKIKNLSTLNQPKYRAELIFWKGIMTEYVEWFDGKLVKLYGEPCPENTEKIISFNKLYSALLTWTEVHQKTKYLEDLDLNKYAFEGLKLLDIGSGPLPSALGYLNCDVYCLEPLLPLYLEAGFPIHIYDQRVKFVHGFSEKMPFADKYFDAIISVNAIDHVDDFNLTASEIRRVLKPGGKLRFHIHYHPRTITEPLELNDQIVENEFSWAKNFKKISESKHKRGSVVEDNSESYALWSNF